MPLSLWFTKVRHKSPFLEEIESKEVLESIVDIKEAYKY